MLSLNEIHHGDCMELMKEIPDGSVDMVLTSPPYDDLRSYNGSLCFNFDVFQHVAEQIKRVLAKGGVCVWVVADATINGSETGSSFKQALYFKEIGLNIHDTMIYAKKNRIPLSHNRYEQDFEYIFVLSKGVPKTFNPIKINSISEGKKRNYANGTRKQDGRMNFFRIRDGIGEVKTTKIHGNIFYYSTGSKVAGSHPAPFPIKLALDQIQSWSSPSDIILDPFMGSGTTAVAAINTGRQFIGIEKVAEYADIARKRVALAKSQPKLFYE